jgi:hypothetical protein
MSRSHHSCSRLRIGMSLICMIYLHLRPILRPLGNASGND